MAKAAAKMAVTKPPEPVTWSGIAATDFALGCDVRSEVTPARTARRRREAIVVGRLGFTRTCELDPATDEPSEAIRDSTVGLNSSRLYHYKHSLIGARLRRSVL